MLAKDLLAKIRRLEIRTRRLVDAVTGGAYHSVFKGQGIEFSEVREYAHGDDVRDIDWNVTARTGVPYVKKYAEERELNVILAVDVSASTAFGSAGVEKKEKMAEAAAMLALSAVRNHDKAGLMLFTDQTELYLSPRQGRTHVLRIIRELLATDTQNRHTGTDLRSAMSVLTRSLKKKSIIFFISDFAGEMDYEQELKILAGKHDLVLIRVTDPVEHLLPDLPGLNLTDAESGASAPWQPGGRARREYEIRSAEWRFGLQSLALRAKVDLIDLSTTDEDSARPLMVFFRRRGKLGRGRGGRA